MISTVCFIKGTILALLPLPINLMVYGLSNNHLLASVDRGNPKGKRDFTMILLAARLGLRASDICGIKFENIHWETNTIRLVQKKTKKHIDLPILTEIGNAIIDYLKYGRPISDLP